MQALILAAGKGTRLGVGPSPVPKCLTPIGDSTILTRCLNVLAESGIDRVGIVTGYQAEYIERKVGSDFAGMPIEYIFADQYSTTNNIMSVLSASQFLSQDDSLLIESDLVFEFNLIRGLMLDPNPNSAAVDRYALWMDGTGVTITDDGLISELFSGSQVRSFSSTPEIYKTINIYKLSGSFLRDSFLPALRDHVAASELHRQDYYEVVFKSLLGKGVLELYGYEVAGNLWYEVDDLMDLHYANQLFGQKASFYERISQYAGGLWRYPNLSNGSMQALPTLPGRWLAADLLWAAPKLFASAPAAQSEVDTLSSTLFRVSSDAVAIVDSRDFDRADFPDVSPIGVFLDEHDNKFPELSAHFPPSSEIAIDLGELVGAPGLSLGAIVSNDSDLLMRIRHQRSPISVFAEYAIHAIDKNVRRVKADLGESYGQYKACEDQIIGSGLFESVKRAGWAFNCVINPKISVSKVAKRILGETGVYFQVDVATNNIMLGASNAKRMSESLEAIERVCRFPDSAAERLGRS